MPIEKKPVGNFNIRIFGDVNLKAVRHDRKEMEYYAVLSLSYRTIDMPVSNSDTEIEVPITKEHYDKLSKALSKPKSEHTALKAKGSLEIILTYSTLN